ncbi:hypothetical protein DFH07DRAFT_819678 [Mycena maculata]|uniref:Transmembrane protein n=1 Tax=Mycena maculata TaxID=230809 RepID=A0AAD7NDE1_9AGAR|nr:hypothetical protein DFH07DRAFT_819678 [Mycena maculata]
MSANQTPAVMTSPVFRYAVLVVLCVVVVMGAGVCYRTRVYRRNMTLLPEVGLRPTASTPRDWGPKPNLFDVYLRPPKEKKPESDWEDIMPISVTRDGHSVSSTARVSVMISMPSSQPFVAPDLMPDDDERYLPYIEFGVSDVDSTLTDVDALRPSSDSDEATSKKG